MKRLFLSIIAIFFCLNSFSQFVIIGTKQGVNYIKPCIENFAYMSTLDYTTFSRYMEQYHYSEGESNAQWYSYTASLDNFLVHAVTNFSYAYGGRSIICWIPKSEMYPKTAMQDIYQKLRPHFLRNENGGELFAFNYDGKAFGCIIMNQSEFYVIRMNYYGNSDKRLKNL